MPVCKLYLVPNDSLTHLVLVASKDANITVIMSSGYMSCV
jgi:hypothetical protein